MIKILSNIGVIAGALLVVLLIVIALFANILAPHDPFIQNVETRLASPSQQYPFGADEFGRDVQTRVIYGLRDSLGVCALAVLIALVVGSLLGAAAEWLGSVVHSAVTCITRFLSAGPGILLTVLIVAMGGMVIRPLTGPGSVIGPRTVTDTMRMAAAIAIVLIPGITRVFSGVVLSIKHNDVKGAIGLIIARISLKMALAVLILAVLGFFGFGVYPQIPSLGGMISGGLAYLRNSPWIILYPGLALAVSALSFNIFGESLNTAVLTRKSGGKTPAQEATPPFIAHDAPYAHTPQQPDMEFDTQAPVPSAQYIPTAPDAPEQPTETIFPEPEQAAEPSVPAPEQATEPTVPAPEQATDPIVPAPEQATEPTVPAPEQPADAPVPEPEPENTESSNEHIIES